MKIYLLYVQINCSSVIIRFCFFDMYNKAFEKFVLFKRVLLMYITFIYYFLEE
jgi:hypothetical protein